MGGEARSDRFIELPARLVLTSQGLKLFQKSGTPVKRVINREGQPKEGLESPKFNASTLQKMVMNAYVEEIYATLPDLLSRRYQLISTNNLVVYAILYKKLSPSLGKMMFETEVVRDYNRKNPKNSIVDMQHINPQQAEALVQARADTFAAIRKHLTEQVAGIINHRGLSEEDRTAMIRSLPKFIAWIDTRIWFLFFVIYQSPAREKIQQVFAGMIARYLEHTRLATHLSNLVMEFVQNAEKAHFERIIVKSGLAGRDDVDRYLRDRDNRKQVIARAVQSKQLLDIAWNMNPERKSMGQQYRVQITISNYGLIDDRVRDQLAKKMKTNVDGIGLSEFYSGADGDADKLGAGLGLLYNSYLEDICKAEGISYKCNIFPEPKQEKTTVRIEMTL